MRDKEGEGIIVEGIIVPKDKVTWEHMCTGDNCLGWPLFC